MWKYRNKEVKSLEDVPQGALGFIYKIENKTNGRYYYGRKEFKSIRNPEVSKAVYDRERAIDRTQVSRTKHKAKSKKAGKTVWRYKRRVEKETNWKSYFGSNKVLKEDKKKGHKLDREIIHYCFSKSELTYQEAKAIFCSGCFEDGENCYNEWVSAKVRKEFVQKNQEI